MSPTLRSSYGLAKSLVPHYTQFQVFDYDSDGRAEISFKTSDGVVDGTGHTLGDPNVDHRDATGRVLSGPEWLSVFDGLTGAEIDTVEFIPQRGNVADWGDAYGNRVDRFLGATAYLDGVHPSLIMSRGYYTRTVIGAWDLVDGKLQSRWVFDSNDWGKEYEGQGNHNLAAADVDRDGQDEIVFGAMTIDDNGKPLYNTGLRHGDALHVADHNPARPGLEVFSPFEDPGHNGGVGAAVAPQLRGRVLGVHAQTWQHCFALLSPERAETLPELQRSIGSLHFAGDYTSATAGTHGAYSEAERVASLIIASLKPSSRSH
jgi:hypothetical protein